MPPRQLPSDCAGADPPPDLLPEGLPSGWDLADEIPEDLEVESLLLEAVDIGKARQRLLGLISADDFRKCEEHQEIIRALIDAGRAMSPAEIADVLGKKRGAIKVLLGRMAKAVEVIPLGNGPYMAKED